MKALAFGECQFNFLFVCWAKPKSMLFKQIRTTLPETNYKNTSKRHFSGHQLLYKTLVPCIWIRRLGLVFFFHFFFLFRKPKRWKSWFAKDKVFVICKICNSAAPTLSCYSFKCTEFVALSTTCVLLIFVIVTNMLIFHLVTHKRNSSVGFIHVRTMTLKHYRSGNV